MNTQECLSSCQPAARELLSALTHAEWAWSAGMSGCIWGTLAQAEWLTAVTGRAIPLQNLFWRNTILEGRPMSLLPFIPHQMMDWCLGIKRKCFQVQSHGIWQTGRLCCWPVSVQAAREAAQWGWWTWHTLRCQHLNGSYNTRTKRFNELLMSPVVGFPVQRRHGHTGESPAKGH